MRFHTPFTLLLACTLRAASSDPTVVYDGSSTVYPIVVAAGEAYAEVNPRFTLTAKPTGTTAGFRAMLARTCTINGASRPINAKEAKAAVDAKVEYLEVPVAFDALSVVGNPRNPWLKDLTVQELKALYGSGGPTTWKAVRPTFPDIKVKLYGAGSDSGTYDYFQEAILGKGGLFRPDIVVSEDDHVLVQGVAADVNAIGYMGLAYLIENAQVLRGIAIDNGNGPVPPTRESVVDGRYVPLSRPIFLYVRPEHASRPDVAGFINFIVDNPQVIESVGYVPFPPHVRTKIKERYAQRIVGSVFANLPVGATLDQAIGTEITAQTQQAGASAAPKPGATAAAVSAPAPSANVMPTPTAIASSPPEATEPAVAERRPVAPTWPGPSTMRYQQDLERLRAISLDLARRTLDDNATIEELSRRSAELKQQIDDLAEAFRTAPRNPTDGSRGLSLAEAASLTQP